MPPPPTPTAILEARGSWRAKEREGEPSLPVEIPPMPPWLSKHAKAEWHRQVETLAAMKCIARGDGPPLGLYCQAIADAAEYRRLRKGFKVGDAEWKQLTVAYYKAAELALKLAAQYGFTPAARARLRVVGEPEKKADGKSRFFHGVN